MLDKAYLRIDGISGGRQEGSWNYLVNIYPNRDTCQTPTLSVNLTTPFENGNPICIGYAAMKQEGKLQQLLQLSYSTQSDD